MKEFLKHTVLSVIWYLMLHMRKVQNPVRGQNVKKSWRVFCSNAQTSLWYNLKIQTPVMHEEMLSLTLLSVLK